MADGQPAGFGDLPKRSLPRQIANNDLLGKAFLPWRKSSLLWARTRLHPTVSLCRVNGEGHHDVIDKKLACLVWALERRKERIAETLNRLVCDTSIAREAELFNSRHFGIVGDSMKGDGRYGK